MSQCRESNLMSILNMPTYKISRFFKVRASYTPVWRERVLNSNLLDTFTKHQIDRPVNVEQLIKCKMQDNLEFLQWSKRYWDQYFPGGDYDAVARRRGSGAPPPTAAPARVSAGAGQARRGTTPTTGGTRVAKPGVGVGAGDVGHDRGIHHPQSLDPMHPTVLIHNGHVVRSWPHLARS